MHGRLASERDLEEAPELDDEELLHVLVAVEVLLADSGDVPIGLHHWVMRAVLLRKEWWSYLHLMAMVVSPLMGLGMLNTLG